MLAQFYLCTDLIGVNESSCVISSHSSHSASEFFTQYPWRIMAVELCINVPCYQSAFPYRLVSAQDERCCPVRQICRTQKFRVNSFTKQEIQALLRIGGIQEKFKEIKNRLHCKPTQIQSEYVNPIIPNGINTKDLMRQVNEFAMNGVLAAFEMSPNGFKLTFK